MGWFRYDGKTWFILENLYNKLLTYHPLKPQYPSIILPEKKIVHCIKLILLSVLIIYGKFH